MALFRARVASSSLLRSMLHAPSRSLSTGAIEMVESKEVPSLKSMMSQMFTLDISSQVGSCMPMSMMRIGTQIHNIELRPGQGGKLVRAAGTSAKILNEPNRSARQELIMESIVRFLFIAEKKEKIKKLKKEGYLIGKIWVNA